MGLCVCRPFCQFFNILWGNILSKIATVSDICQLRQHGSGRKDWDKSDCVFVYVHVCVCVFTYTFYLHIYRQDPSSSYTPDPDRGRLHSEWYISADFPKQCSLPPIFSHTITIIAIPGQGYTWGLRSCARKAPSFGGVSSSRSDRRPAGKPACCSHSVSVSLKIIPDPVNRLISPWVFAPVH